MTNSWLAGFDARAHRAFARAGLADGSTDADVSNAFYTPSTGGPEIPCRILIDRATQQRESGGNGSVFELVIAITCFVADVGSRPERGARWRITDTGEIFTLDGILGEDESQFVCQVKPGN